MTGTFKLRQLVISGGPGDRQRTSVRLSGTIDPHHNIVTALTYDGLANVVQGSRAQGSQYDGLVGGCPPALNGKLDVFTGLALVRRVRASGAVIAVLMLLCAATARGARMVPVQDTAGLKTAIEYAEAGDVITIADGEYSVLEILHAAGQGMPAAPIIVRAAHRQRAHLRSAAVIAFEVSGSYWHFADLDVTGICARDSACEHAFHVTGNNKGFALTGSRIADFNAHIKVNADSKHALPANGVIENNEFFDSHPRHTDSPVAPINIDNAIAWIVRANLIHDFQKDGGGEGSYGAFVKGGSQAPIIERNLVFCARDGAPLGHMVGLSFGAHAMDAKLCPPYWDAARRCDPEVTAGIMRNNIIVNCNDDGIYLNRAKQSAILFNTLVYTAGIEFRFSSSTGSARGNLMTGHIMATQGGQISDGGNVTGLATAGELASWFHPPSPAGRMLSLPRSDATLPDDYCGRARGIFEDVGALQVSSGPCALWR